MGDDSELKSLETIYKMLDGTQTAIGRFSFVRSIVVVAIVSAFARDLTRMSAVEIAPTRAFDEALSTWNATVVTAPALVPVGTPFGGETPYQPFRLSIKYDPYASHTVLPVGQTSVDAWDDVYFCTGDDAQLTSSKILYPVPGRQDTTRPGAERLALRAASKATWQNARKACIAVVKAANDVRRTRAETFTFSHDVLGFPFTVSLRTWIFWLPVAYILSLCYVAVLNAKRRALSSLGSKALLRSGTVGVPSLWRLVFTENPEADGTFVVEPGRGLLRALWAIEAAMFGYLLYMMLVNQYYQQVEMQGVLMTLASVAAYAGAYTLYMRRRILNEVDPELGSAKWAVWVTAAMARTRKSIRLLRREWRLGAGTVLVLSTLFIPVGVDGWHRTANGVALLREPPAPLLGASWGDHFEALGVTVVDASFTAVRPLLAVMVVNRALYAASLATTLLVWISLLVRWRRPARWTAYGRATGRFVHMVFVAMVVDLACGSAYWFTLRFPSAAWVEILLIVGVVALDVLLAYSYASGAALSRLVLWVPIAAIAVDSLLCSVAVLFRPGTLPPLPGLPILFFGMVLLADASSELAGEAAAAALGARAVYVPPTWAGWRRTVVANLETAGRRLGDGVTSLTRRRLAVLGGTALAAFVLLLPAWIHAREHDPEEACTAGQASACSVFGAMLVNAEGHRAKDLDKARERFDRACKLHDARGCMVLGQMYERGLGGLTPDDVSAMSLFRTACSDGEGMGCDFVATMAKTDRGGAKKIEAAPMYDRARHLLAKACADGRAWDCRALGRLYQWGEDGLNKGDAEARQLYGQACRGGDQGGCILLGDMYKSVGQDRVAADSRRSVDLYQGACAAGAAYGCYQLALMYGKGEGGLPMEDPRSLTLFGNACNAGITEACGWLGTLYDEGRAGTQRNQAKAARYYDTGCDGGLAWACTRRGLIYENALDHFLNDPSAAVLYRKACDASDPAGCTRLGLMIEQGRGGQPKDPLVAAKLFRRACKRDDLNSNGCVALRAMYERGEGGDADAAAYDCDLNAPAPRGTGCVSLGRLTERGLAGVKRDPTQAARLYQRACDQAEPQGCGALGRMFENGCGVGKDEQRAAELYAGACDGEDGPSCTRIATMQRPAVGAPSSASSADPPP